MSAAPASIDDRGCGRFLKGLLYKHYMLTVLLVILAFNYVDRLALGLLLQDIKVDLQLSDTQLGFLSGIAFALFYSIMGVPIARWADRGNRVLIISLTTAIWSVPVALCGLAGSFLQLLVLRIGVAVGEAGCVPPAHSLIADYFTRSERPRAVAIYMLGGPLSAVLGYFVAGWLNQLYGWRTTFIVLGLPGIGLAALAWLTLREPRRSSASISASRAADPGASLPALREVFHTLWANRTFRHLLVGYLVVFFFSYGIGKWLPAFFIRSFGLRTGELGTWFALIWGGGGLVGTYIGGELASRYAAGNERLQLRAIAAVYCVFALVSACIYASSTAHMAFIWMGLAALGVTTANGPLFATIQTLVPAPMRAMSIAITYLFANLVGMGLGPLAAGALSDALRPYVGEESLRFALLAMVPGFFWGAWHLWRSGDTVVHDVRRES